jgi:hypothetical protein
MRKLRLGGLRDGEVTANAVIERKLQMPRRDQNPMSEDQASTLKVVTKLNRKPYEPNLSEAEADKRIQEIEQSGSGTHRKM